jgi:hypothetical protein
LYLKRFTPTFQDRDLPVGPLHIAANLPLITGLAGLLKVSGPTPTIWIPSSCLNFWLGLVVSGFGSVGFSFKDVGFGDLELC